MIEVNLVWASIYLVVGVVAFAGYVFDSSFGVSLCCDHGLLGLAGVYHRICYGPCICLGRPKMGVSKVVV